MTGENEIQQIKLQLQELNDILSDEISLLSNSILKKEELEEIKEKVVILRENLILTIDSRLEKNNAHINTELDLKLKEIKKDVNQISSQLNIHLKNHTAKENEFKKLKNAAKIAIVTSFLAFVFGFLTYVFKYLFVKFWSFM